MGIHASKCVAIESVEARAYRVPTERRPESDGTIEWDSTTMVLVEISAGDQTGLGYSYCHRAAATLIADTLAVLVRGADAMQVGRQWQRMVDAVRNIGRQGVAACAISAVDVALWDLKAKLVGLPLVTLLDACRREVPVYGSGGFTSYSQDELTEQLGAWVDEGISRVKMKVGRRPGVDPERVEVARQAIGDSAELFVDANGAYSRKQALKMAHAFADLGVSWFEEPVSSDNLPGLRLLRDQGPPGVEITAGEYGYDPWYFRRMLDAGAVDVLQADATRCLGITGFLHAASLSHGHNLEISAHTAPTIHAPACCAASNARHLEWFVDHVRIEKMFFDGALTPQNGRLEADLSRPGLGVEFKRRDAEDYII
ncbi:MAG: enolase C-terminal domain-like protein [Persicimonas sp.]